MLHNFFKILVPGVKKDFFCFFPPVKPPPIRNMPPNNGLS